VNTKQREYSARMFASLGNQTRLHVVEFLSRGPASVREIAEGVGIKQSITSQHLAVLQHAGITVCRREGQQHYYSLRGPRIVQILQLAEEFYELNRENLNHLWEGESE